MTTASEASAEGAPPGRLSASRGVRLGRPRHWIRWGLFLLLPIVLVAAAVWYVSGGQITSVDDAYVEADKVGVSTDVSGIVREVDVADNQPVAAGQVLYRLDDLPFRLALQRAEAMAGTVRDSLQAQQANYRDMQDQIRQARGDVDYYAAENARQQDLLKAHVASQANADTAQRNLFAAQQKAASLTQQLAAIAADLNGDPGGPVENNPRYKQGLAERDEAARQLAHTVVRAPFAGIATNVPSIAPGKYLAASTTAFFLVSADHAWIDAVPKETDLTYVRVGQPATVTIDAYPGVKWRGVVQSISPAAAQEFALLPAQNSSGNWVKVVQRIPMRIRVDTGHRRGVPRILGGSPAPPAPWR